MLFSSSNVITSPLYTNTNTHSSEWINGCTRGTLTGNGGLGGNTCHFLLCSKVSVQMD